MEIWRKLCELDNVAIALRDLDAGSEVLIDGERIVLIDNIRFGHKFAIKPIKSGEKVIKYCEVIGVATRDIHQGEHVHIHNLRSLRAVKVND